MTDLADQANGAWDSLMQRTSVIKDLPLTDIRIDRRFQRALNVNAAMKIKNEYHPKGLGQVLVAGVAPEDSESAPLACIDGQTRIIALRDLEREVAEGKRAAPNFNPTITAEVFPELTVEEAALLFRLRNNQKPVPPRDRDRIMVVEGDPIMTAVVNEAAEAGYVVFDEDPEKVTMPWITEAKMIVRWDRDDQGQGLLTRALTIQARAFEPPEGTLLGSVHPKVLTATAWLLRKNPQLIEDELTDIMSRIGLPAIEAQAQALANKEGTRLFGAVRSVLVERYNKGKRGAERIGR